MVIPPKLPIIDNNLVLPIPQEYILPSHSNQVVSLLAFIDMLMHDAINAPEAAANKHCNTLYAVSYFLLFSSYEMNVSIYKANR